MNIADLLKKYAKEGDVFYTTIGGDIPFLGIGRNGTIRISEDGWCDLESEGRLMPNGEMVIFPSKDQRDWSVWTKEKEAESKYSQLQEGDYVTYEGGWGRIAEIENENTLVNSYAVQGLLTSTWKAMSKLTKLEHFRADLLHPFDKVLVRDADEHIWVGDFFCYKRVNETVFRGLNGISWKQCVPFNSETEHLLGTADNAPEFYNQTFIIIK